MEEYLKTAEALLQVWLKRYMRDILEFDPGQPAQKQTTADPYRVLGLDKVADDDLIKKRYREMLHLLHPDTAVTPGTEFLFQLVVAAFRQIGRERGWQK
jgi:DnaJ-class molecular chaperone